MDEPQREEGGQAEEVRLQGKAGALRLPADLWDAVLDVAEEYGWTSRLAPALYRAAPGLAVTAAEARRLAERLGRATEDLDAADQVPRGLGAPWAILRAGRPALEEFLRLCRAGGFRVGGLAGEGETP